MRKHVVRLLLRFTVAAFAMHFTDSRALAVDTMADWLGLNTTTGANNFSIISNTSAGGTFQSRVSFVNDATQSQMFFLADQSLSTTLNYGHELHMSGTVTFSAPVDNNHNLFFGWYHSTDTRHRIGLGVAGTTPSEANKIRFDFGVAGTFSPAGNLFSSVTSDGSSPFPMPAPGVSSIPNGTYPFTFDYVPGDMGVMKATVGTFFRDEGPVPKTLTDPAGFEFDSFGFVQRTTSVFDPTITFNLVMSNVTYTGGTAAVPEPPSIMLVGVGLMGICAFAWRRHQVAYQ